MSIDEQSKDNVRSSLWPEVYLKYFIPTSEKKHCDSRNRTIRLRPFKEIICEKPTIHINTLCGQNARLLMWKRVIHIVTTVLYKHVVWQCAVSDLQA
jgi:hypothetical protein